MTYEQKIDAAAVKYGTEIAMPVIRSMYPSKSRGTMKDEFADAFKSGIQWARENPDSETVELREDRGRLEWMIANSAIISKSRNIFYCEIIDGGAVRSYGEITPREAIDAARAESGRG